MVNTRLFEAKEYPLIIYNGQAVVDRAFRFYTVVDCLDSPYEEFDFDFPDYVSSYFRVYNERNGRMILDLTMSRNGPYLVLTANVSEMTFEDNGNYYYEVGYVKGGYEQALRYGTLTVI